MHLFSFSIISILFFLSTITISIEGTAQVIATNSKYENEEYLKLFKVPYSSIKSLRGPLNENLKNAFDENPQTFWVSTAQSGTTLISVTIAFNQQTYVNGFIYQSYSEGTLGIGFPKEMKIYYYEKDNTSANPAFILLDDITTTSTNKRVLFNFAKTVKCYQLKLEWTQLFSHSGDYANKATMKELTLLFPEGTNVNSNILNVYDKSDYRQLTLLDKYKTKTMIDSFNSELKQYGYNENTTKYIGRINSIYNGTLKYDPKREFSTDPKSNVNVIYQRGDIETYARDILRLSTAGTNRQVTGIYGRSNEEITVYVKVGNSKDPLPSIVSTQFIGHNIRWYGEYNKLKEGKQSFIVDYFELSKKNGYNYLDDPDYSTFPGGPMYFTNPFTPEEQSQNILIYIEGGEVFPVFKLGGDEKQYINDLSKCIELNKKNNLTYFDITELVNLRSIMTFKASQAYDIYSKKDSISPQQNLLLWDQYLKDLYQFSGITYTKELEYYDIKNEYININFRWSHFEERIQAYNGAEHIGITHRTEMIRLLNYNKGDMDYILPHEIGHAVDIGERVVSETTNNMVAKYSVVHIDGKCNQWQRSVYEYKVKYLPEDRPTTELLRGCQELVIKSDSSKCKGYYMNIKNQYDFNYVLWWDLECYSHGYWANFNNLYRYNNSLAPSNLSNLEKMVYFSSLALKKDMGYYFTRVGLTFNNGEIVFNENNVSTTYKNLMEKAKSNGLIDKNARTMKYWYLNDTRYDYVINNRIFECYRDINNYDVQIVDVIKESDGYKIVLPKMECPAHLGFEIIESNKVIGFTYDNYFKDTNNYKTGYNPQYTIVAYDQLLLPSKESNYKSAKTNLLHFKFK